MSSVLMWLVISAPEILIVAVIMFAVALLGIRARVRAEYQNFELNAILSSLSEGLLIVDINHRVTRANQRLGVLLRRPPADLIGKRLAEIFPISSTATKQNIIFSKNGTPYADQLVDHVLKRHDFITVFVQCKDASGKTFLSRVSAAPLRLGRTLKGVILTVQMPA